MDYHSDRFADASLLVFAGDKLAGILPANQVGSTVHSHQGLTFGGLVTSASHTPLTLAMLDACCSHYQAAGIDTLVYKALPLIYHATPSEEDRHWLACHGARLVRCDVTSTIDYRHPSSRSSRRRRGIQKAAAAGLQFGPSGLWASFWGILTEELAERHGVSPTHSLSEIMLLADRLPLQIGLYTAERDGEVMAGVVMFTTPFVAHAQYICAATAHRQSGALDGLLDWLIGRYSLTHRYFDFGISTFDQGRQLNEGLVTQKEEFGAGAVCHSVYDVDL